MYSERIWVINDYPDSHPDVLTAVELLQSCDEIVKRGTRVPPSELIRTIGCRITGIQMGSEDWGWIAAVAAKLKREEDEARKHAGCKLIIEYWREYSDLSKDPAWLWSDPWEFAVAGILAAADDHADDEDDD